MRTRLFCCVALATTAFLASSEPAQAQQPCHFQEPIFTLTETVQGVSASVSVACNGGITRCRGRCLVTLWWWDPVEEEWVVTRTPTDSKDRFVLCGQVDHFTVSVFKSFWPPNSWCAISIEYFEWNGTDWTSIGYKDGQFHN